MRARPSHPSFAADSAARRPLALLPAMPWTLASLALVIVLNAAAGTLRAKPNAALTRRYGLGLDTLSQGKLWTIVTSNYLLDHPKALLSTLAVVGLYLAVYELLAGTWAAVAAWFVGGALTSVTIAPLLWLPFARLGWAAPVRAVAVAEFGSSAATWCCLGAVLGWPSGGHWRGWRLWAGLAGVALLAGRLALYRSYTDVEHIAAFGFGLLALARRWPPSRPVRVTGWQLARLGVALAGLLIAMTGVLLATLHVEYARCALLAAAGAALSAAALAVPRRTDPLVLALLLAAGALAISQIPNVATIALVSGSGTLLAVIWRRGIP